MSHPRTLISLSPERMAAAIQGASHRVTYIAPGVVDEVAAALINANDRLGRSKLTVILDVDPHVFRLGYGIFIALESLCEYGVAVRKATGIRIGCLCVDDEGWIFTPTPYLIEHGSKGDSEPNAVRATEDQISAIMKSIAPDATAVDEHQANASPSPALPEIGEDLVKNEDIERGRTSLETNPPRQFDIARIESVFNSSIEFVELELRGLQISRRTIKLPKDLLISVEDRGIRDRIDAAFKLIEKGSDASGETIREKLDEIRRIYLRDTPGYGKVILRVSRPKFEEKLTQIRADIEAFQESAEKNIENEIEKSTNLLVDQLWPRVREKPPESLLAMVSGNDITEELARCYVEDQLNKVMPSAESLIGEMALECRFKAVTYETLKDENFRNHVIEEFNYSGISKIMNEVEALFVIEPIPTNRS